MPGFVTSLSTALHRAGCMWSARRERARLSRSNAPGAQQLAAVLEAAFFRPPPEEQQRWERPIEALRAGLLQSTDRLTFQDYGIPHRRRAAPADGAAVASDEVSRTVADLCRSSAPLHEARVLFHAIRRLQPSSCLELGTCLGLSAAYQGAALALNGTGRLVTLEGGHALARRAREHLHRLDLRTVTVVEGAFQETLPAVCAAHGPFDYAFIDGHHHPEALLAYVQQLRPHLTPHALLVVDDISWSSGMRKAWTHLRNDPQLSTTADLLAFGLCFYDPS